MAQTSHLPCLVLECRQQPQELKPSAERIRVFTFCPIVLSRGGGGGCAGRRIKLVVVCHCGAKHEAVGEFRCDAGEYRSCADDSLLCDVLSKEAGAHRAEESARREDGEPKFKTLAETAAAAEPEKPKETAAGSKDEPSIEPLDLNSDTKTNSSSDERPSPANSYFNFGVHGLGVSMTSESLRAALQEETAPMQRKETAMPGTVDWHGDGDGEGEGGDERSTRDLGPCPAPVKEQLTIKEAVNTSDDEDDQDDEEQPDSKQRQPSEQTIQLEAGFHVSSSDSADAEKNAEQKPAGQNESSEENSSDPDGSSLAAKQPLGEEADDGGEEGATKMEELSEAEAAVKAVEEQAKREYGSLELAESGSDKMTENGSPPRNRLTDFDEEAGGEVESSFNSATGQSDSTKSSQHAVAACDVYRHYPFNQIYSVNHELANSEKRLKHQQKTNKPGETCDKSGKQAPNKRKSLLERRVESLENFSDATMTAAIPATANAAGAGNQGAPHGPAGLELNQFVNLSKQSGEQGAHETSTDSNDESVMVRVGSYESLASAQSRIFRAATAEQNKQLPQVLQKSDSKSQSRPQSLSDSAESSSGNGQTEQDNGRRTTVKSSVQCPCLKPMQSALVLLQQSAAALSAASASTAAAAAAVTTACLTQNVLTSSCQPKVHLCCRTERLAAAHRASSSKRKLGPAPKHKASPQTHQHHHQQQQQQKPKQQSNFASLRYCNSGSRYSARRLQNSLSRVLGWDCSGGDGCPINVRREAAVHHLLQPTESFVAICSDAESASRPQSP